MQKIPSVTDLRNILILRGEGSLGDAIISSCCYRNIKQANPQVHISVVCFGAGYQFLKENPYIDRIIKLPIPKLIRPNQRWFTLIGYGIKLRKYHFDLVLDSSNKDYQNWRLFKWLAGADRVLDCFTSPVQPFGALQKHGSLHECAILQILGIKNPSTSYDLPVPPQDQQAVQTWLTQQQVPAYILLNPSGSIDKRRFSAQTLKRLAALLAPFRQPIIIPSMPAMYAHWQEATKDIPNVHVKKTGSVFELFEWVRRATLVITPDTSVVHIAAGFSKPTLVFYNTLSVYNAPNNPHALIVETDRDDVNNCDWALVQTQLEKLHTELTACAAHSTK
ncbi:MAG: glycosyltransferase family 9 protein [Elusimicrobiaceae bacterium]|nr:glycosyltransferase family 9 protein [Elusimicrobiaceae bacterium]